MTLLIRKAHQLDVYKRQLLRFALALFQIDIKYEGYILKAKRDAKHLRDMDNVVLPTDICYDEVANLSLEARQKLAKIMPLTMGQASRISGVNPEMCIRDRLMLVYDCSTLKIKELYTNENQAVYAVFMHSLPDF